MHPVLTCILKFYAKAVHNDFLFIFLFIFVDDIILAGDIYWLYTGLCAIPDEIRHGPTTSTFVYTLVEVTRSVCRSLCSVTYNDYCSSFLYISRNRSCILTPYTGEWLASNAASCATNATGLEFYRRQRYLG